VFVVNRNVLTETWNGKCQMALFGNADSFFRDFPQL
jgi:hypothetical protein